VEAREGCQDSSWRDASTHGFRASRGPARLTPRGRGGRGSAPGASIEGFVFGSRTSGRGNALGGEGTQVSASSQRGSLLAGRQPAKRSRWTLERLRTTGPAWKRGRRLARIRGSRTTAQGIMPSSTRSTFSEGRRRPAGRFCIPPYQRLPGVGRFHRGRSMRGPFEPIITRRAGRARDTRGRSSQSRAWVPAAVEVDSRFEQEGG